jgi:hypothetical protein
LESLGFVGEEVNKVIIRGVQQILRNEAMPDIAPKHYANFNKLEDLEVEHIVDFIATSLFVSSDMEFTFWTLTLF